MADSLTQQLVAFADRERESAAMRTIETAIDIDASPDEVWAVVTDFARYPEWNPFLVRAEGNPVVGDRLEVVESGRHFAWLGHLVVPGLFDGRHEFVLEPAGSGTRFVQREQFRGILVPLLGSKLFEQTEAGFVLMNEALAERSAAGRRTRAEGAA